MLSDGKERISLVRPGMWRIWSHGRCARTAAAISRMVTLCPLLTLMLRWYCVSSLMGTCVDDLKGIRPFFRPLGASCFFREVCSLILKIYEVYKHEYSL